MKRLDAHVRSEVRAALDVHLRHQPTKSSKNQVKRLHGMSRPQYRLRVDDVRIFYDVSEGRVEVLAVVMKSDAESWLKAIGGKA